MITTSYDLLRAQEAENKKIDNTPAVVERVKPDTISENEGLICPYCYRIVEKAVEEFQENTPGFTECNHCYSEFRYEVSRVIYYYGYREHKKVGWEDN